MAGRGAALSQRIFKIVVFLACASPGVLLAYKLYQLFLGGQSEILGPDPAGRVIHDTGRDALFFLFVTLSITPVRRLFKFNRLISVRRMLGVWSFTYAVFHLCAYLVFNQLCYSWATCDISGIVTDVLKRKFIFMGMLAWTILLALAITSTNGWMRRLKKKWTTLHRLVYVAAIAAVIHFAWGQKADISEPLKWGAVLTALLSFRVYLTIQKRRLATSQRRVPSA